MQILFVNNMSETPKKMGRPAVEPGKRKGSVISLRFNDAEFDAIKAAANKWPTLSEWARDTLLKKAGKVTAA